jgi:hypothetical protein
VPRARAGQAASCHLGRETLRLTLLQPAIIQSILAGQQPSCMSLLWFQRNPLPADWVAQRDVVTGFDA